MDALDLSSSSSDPLYSSSSSVTKMYCPLNATLLLPGGVGTLMESAVSANFSSRRFLPWSLKFFVLLVTVPVLAGGLEIGFLTGFFTGDRTGLLLGTLLAGDTLLDVAGEFPSDLGLAYRFCLSSRVIL